MWVVFSIGVLCIARRKGFPVRSTYILLDMGRKKLVDHSSLQAMLQYTGDVIMHI